jgi:hypothetical protein
MAPLKCVIIWCGSVALFLLTFIVLFLLTPQEWLYMKIFGDENFIEEEAWNNILIPILFFSSAIIDCIGIAVFAKIRNSH